MIDYKLLEALAHVVRQGGFDKAARTLHLTQSAVSQRIRQLEEQSGLILLARSTPPRPTAAGIRMLKHYRQVRLLEEDLSDVFAPSGRTTGGVSNGTTGGEGGADRSAPSVSLAIGVNGDSLSTWFFQALEPFLEQDRVLLDLRIEDQVLTHRLLRDGEVVGCVSTLDKAIQGCSMDYLGRIDYRLVCSPEFARRWFPGGVTPEAACRAPAVAFDRVDNLNLLYYMQKCTTVPSDIPTHYIPWPEQFNEFILAGRACGMMLDQHSEPLLRAGRLVNPDPNAVVPVHLYWHSWNIASELLQDFSRVLLDGAHRLLQQDQSEVSRQLS